MMITILSGGTGTPKLIQGIKEIYPQEEINVIVNTVENEYFSGGYIAADIDTVMYTFADMIDERYWYGIKGDTFHIREKLIELGTEELLTIGDQDRAIEIQKAILEDSDIKINTKEHGEIEFHEFLIKYGGEPEVLEVIYSDVNPSPELIETIEKSDKVIIGPSNPITSIRPITSIKGVEEALKGKEVIAVSPFVGNDAFSGPAGKFMTAFGYETSSKGVAELYKAFLNTLVIDNQDAQMKGDLEEIVPEVIVTNTFMNSIEDKINLAKVVLNME